MLSCGYKEKVKSELVTQVFAALQDLFESNWVRLLIAGVACIPGALTLCTLYDLFSKPDVVLLDLIIKDHILFKVWDFSSVKNTCSEFYFILYESFILLYTFSDIQYHQFIVQTT